ncbi:hypothetical protein I3760_07G129900 [Carya illinoinensis]|uniref:Proton pump-interactor 1 n=1 Tax=Carya illinoinensis TaxID=32201 RepID=A0A922JHI3_CARIL|nr:hypothetical protein I3760_07G129900 [Carya illinoinensis]KAG2697991.1 hypothetical protein I3760_07G129900 [Carya illinoinensis]KAG6704454.1 hypothetical protein I3842_07G134100 [Carya illinoinensis]
MTADVDAHGVGEVSEVPNGEEEEKCSFQDLHRENNGVMIINGSNANKDDADSSYVFVGVSDAVSGDHVEPLDLNEGHVENLGSGGVAKLDVVENGECNQNNGGGDGGSEGSQCEIVEGQLGGSDGVEEENGTEAVGEPEAHPQQQPEPEPQRPEVEEKIKVEESSEDAGETTRSHPVVSDVSASELCESSMQVRDGQTEVVNFDSIAVSELQEIDGEDAKADEDRNPDLLTDGKENEESRDVVSVGVRNYLDQEKEAPELDTNEIPPEGSAPGALAVDLEQNAQTTPPVTDTDLVNEVGNDGPVCDENGDGSPINHTEDGPSETLDPIQKTAEQNGSPENAESLPLPSPPIVCENAAAKEIPVEADSGEYELGLEQSSKTEVVSSENEDCLPSDHDQDSISDNFVNNELVGSIQNAPEQNGSSQNVDCLPASVVCGVVLRESCENFPTAPDDDSVVEKDTGNEASPTPEKFSTYVADDQRPETGVENLGTNESERSDSCPADHTKLELEAEDKPDESIDAEDGPDENIEAKNGLDDAILSGHESNDGKSETETGSVVIDSDEKVSNFPTNALKEEFEVSTVVIACDDGHPHSVAATEVESHVKGLVENELSNTADADVKSESEGENLSTLSSRDMPCDDGIESDSKVQDGSANSTESALNCVSDAVHVEDGVDQLTGTNSGEQPTSQAAEGTTCIQGHETSITSPGGSACDALEGQNSEVVQHPFYYLIRLPRYDDDNLREQINHAQLQVDEKTQSRDAIRAEIQRKRATWKEAGDHFKATKLEERAARDLLKSKRQEMDSAQSVINRVKNSISVEDIDGRIRNMEHAIQHETLPLSEEKQLIREIKQLKQLREKLSSDMGRQDNVQSALVQKDEIEARLKLLRKELDILRDNVMKAEAVTTAARKRYDEENEKFNELHAQFKAADNIRQEAYAHLQSLKKQLHDKNEHFWKYKDDIRAATDLASEGKKEELQRLCINQTERVMELWNKNDEFRKEYIRCNIRSTLRRLRTLDGRSLGPDEQPPLIPKVVYERVAKDKPVSLPLAVEQEKQIVQVETEKVKLVSDAKAVEQKKQTTNRSEKPVKPAPLGNGLANVSSKDEIEVEKEEKPKQTKEEEELARKMEELRREEEKAKLRELHLLEEKAKAKEALERKKRNAEKAQARAMLRAQKEAEQKEKEREKKARKKDKKKAATVAVEATDGANEGESAPSSEIPLETPKESETGENTMTVAKRSKKPSQFTKQSKAKSIPLPLRNRTKRRMQPWMWVLLTALVVFALFLVGNSSFLFDLGLQRFGF